MVWFLDLTNGHLWELLIWPQKGGWRLGVHQLQNQHVCMARRHQLSRDWGTRQGSMCMHTAIDLAQAVVSPDVPQVDQRATQETWQGQGGDHQKEKI